jgi:serine protease Do
LQDSERDGTGLANKKGVVVTAVLPNSFAEDIRLLEKDVIVSINRQQVSSVEDVRRIQGTLKPGDPVAFRVLRRINLGPAGPSSEWTSFFLSGALPVE